MLADETARWLKSVGHVFTGTYHPSNATILEQVCIKVCRKLGVKDAAEELDKLNETDSVVSRILLRLIINGLMAHPEGIFDSLVRRVQVELPHELQAIIVSKCLVLILRRQFYKDVLQCLLIHVHQVIDDRVMQKFVSEWLPILTVGLPVRSDNLIDEHLK